VAFLEGRLLSSQSEQSEKFSKSLDWLEKAGPPKKPLLFLSCKQANCELQLSPSSCSKGPFFDFRISPYSFYNVFL